MITTGTKVRINAHYPDKWIQGLTGVVLGEKENATPYFPVKLEKGEWETPYNLPHWLFAEHEMDAIPE